MATAKGKIREIALKILSDHPGGIRYMQLARYIQEQMPDVPIKTVYSAMWDLERSFPSEVYKPQRGLFRHTQFRDSDEEQQESAPIVTRIKEEDFYQPFVDYLENELEEVTKAITLGGNKFRDKWGTPDVIGIKKPKRSDIIQFQPEIISAEIKLDSNGLITAFGQACSYRLFSHKVYIVIPKDVGDEDGARIESLCLIFGIGLILFNSAKSVNPEFEIRVRPSKQDPDMFYVNKYLRLVETDLFD